VAPSKSTFLFNPDAEPVVPFVPFAGTAHQIQQDKSHDDVANSETVSRFSDCVLATILETAPIISSASNAIANCRSQVADLLHGRYPEAALSDSEPFDVDIIDNLAGAVSIDHRAVERCKAALACFARCASCFTAPPASPLTNSTNAPTEAPAYAALFAPHRVKCMACRRDIREGNRCFRAQLADRHGSLDGFVCFACNTGVQKVMATQAKSR
jgi:hypothetical protein